MKIKSVKIREVDFNKLLKKSGLSIRKLGAEAGIGYSLIAKAERGLLCMSEENWQKIKLVLDKHLCTTQTKN